MKNFTKIGLSAVAAFALMFTTTIGVVAHEQVKASNDNVEVTKSMEAKTLAETAQKLDAEFVKNKVHGNTTSVQVMKRPVDNNNSGIALTIPHHYIGTGNPNDIDEEVVKPENWDTNPGSFNCDAGGDIPCMLEVPSGTSIEDYLLDDLQADPAQIRSAASSGRSTGP